LTLDRDLIANGVATDSGERLFYHNNTLYSVFGMSDSNRVLPERYLYDAYGRPVIWLPGPDSIYGTTDDIRTANGSSTVQNVRLFTGREWDAESLLYFFRARYHSPQFGRLLMRDRLLDSDSKGNAYSYVGNRPIRRLDPSGLLSEPIEIELPIPPLPPPWLPGDPIDLTYPLPPVIGGPPVIPKISPGIVISPKPPTGTPPSSPPSSGDLLDCMVECVETGTAWPYGAIGTGITGVGSLRIKKVIRLPGTPDTTSIWTKCPGIKPWEGKLLGRVFLYGFIAEGLYTAAVEVYCLDKCVAEWIDRK
jgi:RHS repeat-associated protein